MRSVSVGGRGEADCCCLFVAVEGPLSAFSHCIEWLWD
jgi:hypothetical protein